MNGIFVTVANVTLNLPQVYCSNNSRNKVTMVNASKTPRTCCKPHKQFLTVQNTAEVVSKAQHTEVFGVAALSLAK